MALTHKARVGLPEWGILFGLSVLEITLHLAVTKYSIPSAQTTIKHEALEILIITIPVGLAVRICGSHPQRPGSTPGLGNFVRIERFRNHVTFGRNKVLNTVPSAQTTIKHEALEILINNILVGLAVRICGFRQQGPCSTPELGNFVRIERFRNHVTFGRNKLLKTVCTNHIQTRGAGN